MRCRGSVGHEPVLLSLDFHLIADLVESGDVTEADVIDAIMAAMATPNFRIRSWSQLVNWARRSAKDRLASIEKPLSRAGPPRPIKPSNLSIAVGKLLNEQPSERPASNIQGTEPATGKGIGCAIIDGEYSRKVGV